MKRPVFMAGMGRARLPALLLLSLMGLAGCSTSPNPSLYTIAPVRGTEQSSTPKVVVLQQIGIARYLDRTPIVRSSEGYRLDVMANDWWGEPLTAMLARVLVEELGQRMPQSTVLNEGGRLGQPDDHQLNIQRWTAVATARCRFAAQASLSFRQRRRCCAASASLCR